MPMSSRTSSRTRTSTWTRWTRRRSTRATARSPSSPSSRATPAGRRRIWLQENLSSDDLGELLKAALDPEALEALNNAPAYLRETSLFPYQNGLALVQRLIADGGYDAINAAFADPPDSTEQVLHPNKYVQREAPINVRIPAGFAGLVGPGWSEAVRDTLGELILRVWLTQHNISAEGARRATEGWGGDRLVLLRGANGSLAVAMKTTWDTADDALEFATTLLVVSQDPGFNGEVVPPRRDSATFSSRWATTPPRSLAALRD